MLLAIDVGNTTITSARVTADGVGEPRRAPSDASASADELATALGGLGGVDEIVLASVVPRLTERFHELARTRAIHVLFADHTTVPVEARVERPAEVGADRLVNAFAAARLYGAPAVVVDIGTATTFDVVSADGAYVGGAIAPGPELGAWALAERTAQLPRIALAAPPSAIGRNTVAAMQSGVVLGHAAMVRGLVEAISEELDAQPMVILTGGLAAAAWAAEIPGVDVIDPLLTLRGLALLHAETGAEMRAGVLP
jgi:type III pantothenate kinase